MFYVYFSKILLKLKAISFYIFESQKQLYSRNNVFLNKKAINCFNSIVISQFLPTANYLMQKENFLFSYETYT